MQPTKMAARSFISAQAATGDVGLVQKLIVTDGMAAPEVLRKMLAYTVSAIEDSATRMSGEELSGLGARHGLPAEVLPNGNAAVQLVKPAVMLFSAVAFIAITWDSFVMKIRSMPPLKPEMGEPTKLP